MPLLRVSQQSSAYLFMLALSSRPSGLSGYGTLRSAISFRDLDDGVASIMVVEPPNTVDWSYFFAFRHFFLLTGLEESVVQHTSIEAAQLKLDLAILKELPTKTIVLGVLDLNDERIESPMRIAERIREALRYVAAERLMIAPDCGMKYLPREVAYGKLEALVQVAASVRETLG